MNTRTREAHGRLALSVRETLERELGAPWGPTDTLPLCPVCGTPPMPGRHGGFLCMTKKGQLRAPHAARVIAWGRELAARVPPCAAAMGCLCAGHARGNDPGEPCDTSERATTPDELAARRAGIRSRRPGSA